LWILGRHREALDDLRRAARVLRSAADTIWEARTLTPRALVHLACGSTRRAEIDLARAELLFATTSQDLEVAFTWHNRGLVAFRSGAVPMALAPGLPGEALAETDAAVRSFQPNGRQATKKAELLLSAARAALAMADPQVAMERALAAR